MIYQKHGKIWTMDFVFNGRRYQQSTKTENKRVAEDIERAFRTNLARGEVGIEEKPKRAVSTVAALLEDLQKDYELRGKASDKNLSVVRVVNKAFGSRRADTLNSEDLTAYVERKLKAKSKPRTVNNHLQVLASAYKLAKLPAPAFQPLPVNNARQGFFTEEEMERLCGCLPEDLVDFCRFAYLTGMRLGEIRKLKWSYEQEGLLKIPGVDTKNRSPRTIAIEGGIAPIIERRRKARLSHGVLTDHIFHRQGKPVGIFRRAWIKACSEAGIPGRLFHDFRRVAVRNLVRAGVPQSVAMAISGHKTISVFQRYNITDEQDLRNAMKLLEDYRNAEAEKRKVVSIGG
jgi:integrase